MSKVKVLEHYCKGCGLCIDACPRHILALSENVDKRGVHIAYARQDTDCIGCLNCVLMCPDAALEVD